MPELAPAARRARTSTSSRPTTPRRARERLLQVVCERIPARFGLDPMRDVQVLVPDEPRAARRARRSTPSCRGAEPRGASRASSGRLDLRAGDKVMQIENDYDKDVFNGDIGVVASIDPVARELSGRASTAARVAYDVGDLDELALAYATTIHKSQGSEYPAVVIPLTRSTT